MKPVFQPAAALALTQSEIAIVKCIAQRYAPEHQLRVFGSRALATADSQVKPWADLDLLFEGPTCLTLDQRANLREAFSESELSMRIDLLEAEELPEQWKIIRAWPL